MAFTLAGCLTTVLFTLTVIDCRPGGDLYTRDTEGFRHHNFEDMTGLLKHYEKTYPNLCRLYSVGESVEGRKLYVLEVSDNPGKHDPGEPEFKYIANMHGNEVVGREMLLELIKKMLMTYGSNERLTSLVKNTRMHFMLSMNPDGYEKAYDKGKGDWLIGRNNANDKDLNRNFPDQFIAKSPEAQPETKAVIDWIINNPFVLSANLHGGSLVANYPFDDNKDQKTVYTPSPDDDVFVHLAKTYANQHPTMHLKNPPWECDGVPADHFVGGITNGAAWYNVAGGMQDFNYLHSSCMEITIEMGCNKFPDEVDLPRYWRDNEKPLVAFIEQIHRGAKGFVKDASGSPIIAAEIVTSGRQHVVKTAKDGDYWRLLMPGKYTLTVKKDGYAAQSQSVTVDEGPATVLNFTLTKRSGDQKGSERILDSDSSLLPSAPAKDSTETNNPDILYNAQSVKPAEGVGDATYPLLSQLSALAAAANGESNHGEETATANGDEGEWNQQGRGLGAATPVDAYGNPLEQDVTENADLVTAKQFRLPSPNTDLDRLAMESPYEQFFGKKSGTSFYDNSQQIMDGLTLGRDALFDRRTELQGDEA